MPPLSRKTRNEGTPLKGTSALLFSFHTHALQSRHEVSIHARDVNSTSPCTVFGCGTEHSMSLEHLELQKVMRELSICQK